MARFAAACGFQSSVPYAAGIISDVMNAATMPTDQVAFEAALATLVADGASPTQAHVTAVNSAYTTLKADFAAGNLSTAPNSSVVISFDAAVVTNIGLLRKAANALLLAVQGGIL